MYICLGKEHEWKQREEDKFYLSTTTEIPLRVDSSQRNDKRLPSNNNERSKQKLIWSVMKKVFLSFSLLLYAKCKCFAINPWKTAHEDNDDDDDVACLAWQKETKETFLSLSKEGFRIQINISCCLNE